MNTQVPRGIEVLIKKASVDPAFKSLLLDRRAEAADAIGLLLEPAEAMMLAATPRGQLESVIARADVPQAHRRAFLGRAAAAMLAALGVGAVALAKDPPSVGAFGNRPDEPAKPEPSKKEPSEKDKQIETRVLAVIAKLFKVSPKELKGEASLVGDLYATASQLVLLRRQLEKQFKLNIPRKDFENLHTVDDVVGYVKEAIQRRDGGKPSPNPTLPATRGIQPDRGTTGGIRPQ
jgi:acyl carrier protein